MKMDGKVFCLKISTIMGTHFKISTAMTIKQIRLLFFLSSLYFYCHSILIWLNVMLAQQRKYSYCVSKWK